MVLLQHENLVRVHMPGCLNLVHLQHQAKTVRVQLYIFISFDDRLSASTTSLLQGAYTGVNMPRLGSILTR
jgi:hypothetical protein